VRVARKLYLWGIILVGSEGSYLREPRAHTCENRELISVGTEGSKTELRGRSSLRGGMVIRSRLRMLRLRDPRYIG
jgi:hypothetical protein